MNLVHDIKVIPILSVINTFLIFLNVLEILLIQCNVHLNGKGKIPKIYIDVIFKYIHQVMHFFLLYYE